MTACLCPRGYAPEGIASLELDLEVFSGPFDLLLTLVLREEVDLLEVDLADVVLTYIDHLESRGELDLEVATEFIVLVAALLELKSRLVLGGDGEELIELEPGEAAEELLARLLDAMRFRTAAEYLSRRFADESGWRYRSAQIPAALRKRRLEVSESVHDPVLLGAAIGDMLRTPPPIDVRHLHNPRVTVAERLDHLRALLRAAGPIRFDDAVVSADRVTVAVTIFALLELHKQGEATWSQPEPFGDISISAVAREDRPVSGAGAAAMAEAGSAGA